MHAHMTVFNFNFVNFNFILYKHVCSFTPSTKGMAARANSSISAMRPPCYYLLEEIVILGVIHGSLVWRVCNPAAPAGHPWPEPWQHRTHVVVVASDVLGIDIPFATLTPRLVGAHTSHSCARALVHAHRHRCPCEHLHGNYSRREHECGNRF